MKLSFQSYTLAGFLLLAANVQANQFVKPESITPTNNAYSQAQADNFIIPTSASDTVPHYYYANKDTATFSVTLEKAYDLDQFYLWNYTSTAYLDSVKMNFKNSSGAVVDSVTLTPILAGDEDNGQYKSNVYGLGKIVKNVKSVDFTLYRGNNGIKICALGFNGVKTSEVPEPSGVALLGLGALTFLIRRKR